MSPPKSFFIFLIFLIFVLPACGQPPEKRKYVEVVVAPSPSSAPGMPSDVVAAPHTLPKLAWKTPEGWIEKEGSGFRLATFIREGDAAIECSMSSLGSVISDLKSNVVRWMNQIHLTNVADEQTDSFLTTREKITSEGGLNIEIFDFTGLQSSAGPDAASMIAAMVYLPEETVFIKMTGTKSAVTQNLENFKKLCQSLKVQP